MCRIHILGASGSGTTTLGVAVADLLAVPHVDTDAVYWLATDPPFTTPRPIPERIALLREKLPLSCGWVLSGSAISWAQPFEPLYNLIVYLWLDPVLRMERLRLRERTRYGRRVDSGGDMAMSSADFLAWAAAYDTAGREQRSRVAHEEWLAGQRAPIIRLNSAEPVHVLADAVLSSISNIISHP